MSQRAYMPPTPDFPSPGEGEKGLFVVTGGEAEEKEAETQSVAIDGKAGELLAIGGCVMVGALAWGFLQTISAAAGINFVFQALQGVGALLGLNWTDRERKELQRQMKRVLWDSLLITVMATIEMANWGGSETSGTCKELTEAVLALRETLQAAMKAVFSIRRHHFDSPLSTPFADASQALRKVRRASNKVDILRTTLAAIVRGGGRASSSNTAKLTHKVCDDLTKTLRERTSGKVLLEGVALTKTGFNRVVGLSLQTDKLEVKEKDRGIALIRFSDIQRASSVTLEEVAGTALRETVTALVDESGLPLGDNLWVLHLELVGSKDFFLMVTSVSKRADLVELCILSIPWFMKTLHGVVPLNGALLMMHPLALGFVEYLKTIPTRRNFEICEPPSTLIGKRHRMDLFSLTGPPSAEPPLGNPGTNGDGMKEDHDEDSTKSALAQFERGGGILSQTGTRGDAMEEDHDEEIGLRKGKKLRKSEDPFKKRSPPAKRGGGILSQTASVTNRTGRQREAECSTHPHGPGCAVCGRKGKKTVTAKPQRAAGKIKGSAIKVKDGQKREQLG